MTPETAMGAKVDEGFDTDAIMALLPHMTPEERAEVDAILAADKAIWRPLPGPQTMAYESLADVTGYGGAAGGGKTDLMIGLALTKHRKAMILRREATQLTGIVDRMTDILGSKDGYNGQDKIWRLNGGRRQIEFGSVANPGDETKYQGRPHDLLGFDELSNFLEVQFRFLCGWARTTKKGQRVRIVSAFNPPVNADGRWVIAYFGPWLDDAHPSPAAPGELRWFAVVNGKDVEVADGKPFDHKGETIRPMSRTFIPSRIGDNPFLVGTGYMATLQALPEPLRSQMLYGDFRAGMEDDPWQVIPTAWIDAAMARWRPAHEMARSVGPMDSMGVDVAAGGRDKEVIARRHGNWFDQLTVYDGEREPNGAMTGSRVVGLRRDQAVVHVDVVGPGGAAHGFLNANGVQSVGINGALPSGERTVDGSMAFFNLRCELWWRAREALDPMRPEPLALPNDTALRADLAAPRWSPATRGIKVEAKEETKKRIGRSPDRGDAVIYALRPTMKRAVLEAMGARRSEEYDPRQAIRR